LVPLIDTILSVDIYVTTAMSVHANLAHICTARTETYFEDTHGHHSVPAEGFKICLL
jgi:hypothetical protein